MTTEEIRKNAPHGATHFWANDSLICYYQVGKDTTKSMTSNDKSWTYESRTLDHFTRMLRPIYS